MIDVSTQLQPALLQQDYCTLDVHNPLFHMDTLIRVRRIWLELARYIHMGMGSGILVVNEFTTFAKRNFRVSKATYQRLWNELRTKVQHDSSIWEIVVVEKSGHCIMEAWD